MAKEKKERKGKGRGKGKRGKGKGRGRGPKGCGVRRRLSFGPAEAEGDDQGFDAPDHENGPNPSSGSGNKKRRIAAPSPAADEACGAGLGANDAEMPPSVQEIDDNDAMDTDVAPANTSSHQREEQYVSDVPAVPEQPDAAASGDLWSESDVPNVGEEPDSTSALGQQCESDVPTAVDGQPEATAGVESDVFTDVDVKPASTPAAAFDGESARSTPTPVAAAGGEPPVPAASSSDDPRVPLAALPEHGPAQPPASEPGSDRAPYARGPTIHHSPACLREISPPGCTITLNCALIDWPEIFGLDIPRQNPFHDS